jgi:hypothetical protein
VLPLLIKRLAFMSMIGILGRVFWSLLQNGQHTTSHTSFLSVFPYSCLNGKSANWPGISLSICQARHLTQRAWHLTQPQQVCSGRGEACSCLVEALHGWSQRIHIDALKGMTTI